MLTIQIHDEKLAQKLQQLAAEQHRPIEEVLKTLLADYPIQLPELSSPTPPVQSDSVKRIRRTAFAKARRYWESVGDPKAALTDEELDEQFGAFDEEGIPRLKFELPDEPPKGTLAYAGKIAQMTRIETGGSINGEDIDDILNEEFADYLLKRMNSEYDKE